MRSDNGYGGVNQYALRLMSALVKYGDVRVVAMISPEGAGLCDDIKGENFLEIVLSNPWSLAVVAEQHDIDVIHTPIQHFIGITFSVPMISTLHDLQPFHFPEFFTPEEIEYRNIYYRRSAEFSERVIVTYEHVKSDIVRYYDIPTDKIDVCPFGTPDRSCISEVEIRRVRFCYHLPDIYLLYPANTWRHKNHTTLLTALGRLRDVYGTTIRLVCTGHQQEDYFPELVRQIEMLNIGAQVQFTGFLSEEDMPAVVAGATLVVIPTLYEAGSLPLVEAMSYAVPVICSNVTSLPDTIGDERFVFDPLDVEGLTDLIYRMLTDESLRQDNILNSRRRRDEMGWEKAVTSFIDSYRRAVEGFQTKRNLPYYISWIANGEFFFCDSISSLRSEAHQLGEELRSVRDSASGDVCSCAEDARGSQRGIEAARTSRLYKVLKMVTWRKRQH